MKVGDLVELSAYGKKRVWLKSLRGLHGIVIELIHGPDSRWRIHWFGMPTNVMYQKDIKHIKVKKRLDKTTSV